jgi:hypothetical protein
MLDHRAKRKRTAALAGGAIGSKTTPPPHRPALEVEVWVGGAKAVSLVCTHAKLGIWTHATLSLTGDKENTIAIAQLI